ncbi:unnamed protein product [Musa hybrid cultivar]
MLPRRWSHAWCCTICVSLPRGQKTKEGTCGGDSLESPQLASLVDSERSLNYLGESLREALAEDLYQEACLRSKVNNCAGTSFIGPIASCNLIGDSVATP